METFGEKAFDLYTSIPTSVPGIPGIEIINPYNSNKIKQLVKTFYTKFFSDTGERIFVIGINPGRFGGGITGINFTDPVALRDICGIDNNLGSRTELSSKFIYEWIVRMGGPEVFYKSFYLCAMYPLALVKNGKNINYYDGKEILNFFLPAIADLFEQQYVLGANKNIAICLGKENLKHLQKLNDIKGYFKEIILLEHPRYIMQYKLRSKEEYLQKFIHITQMLI